MPGRWTQDITKILISLWEQHKILYVVTHKDYHNKTERQVALQEITKYLNECTNSSWTLLEVSKKIHGLRTQYLSERNKVSKSVSSGASADDIYTPKLWSYPLLEFLNSSTVVKSSTSNLHCSDTVATQESNVIFEGSMDELERANLEMNLDSPQDSSVANDSDIQSTTRSATPTVVSKKRKRCGDFSDLLIKATDALNMQMPVPPIADDHISIFAKSVEVELRSIQNKRRLRYLKMNIMSLIHNAQEEEDNDE
ncbi:hypothetical protein FQR65_LT19092 [Abscondita terminalis]|nr:hypothetical protein FQR65_LT19092 [Abscondita terminalis]